jgi:hypothetical protein
VSDYSANRCAFQLFLRSICSEGFDPLRASLDYINFLEQCDLRLPVAACFAEGLHLIIHFQACE